MKNLTKKQIILNIIFLLLIIIGAVVVFTKGFNFELKYKDAQRAQIHFEEDFNINDIKGIAKEVFDGQDILIQYVEMFKDTVQITTTSISDEQTQKLVDKLNEKYKAEEAAKAVTENATTEASTTESTLFTKEDIEVSKVAHIQLRDIVTPVILNLSIAVGITLLYVAIRYHRIGILKVVVSFVMCGIIIPEALVLSILAITRAPMGTITLPIILVTYVAGISLFIVKKEKELEKELLKTED